MNNITKEKIESIVRTQIEKEIAKSKEALSEITSLPIIEDRSSRQFIQCTEIAGLQLLTEMLAKAAKQDMPK